MSSSENSNRPKEVHVDIKTNSSVPTKENAPKDFLTNLWEGNIGLAKTYWVYGVLGGFVWAVGILAINPEQKSDLQQTIYLLMGAYYFVVYVGIWRAADKFTGSKIWAILAKFVVVIVALPTAIKLVKWVLSNY